MSHCCDNLNEIKSMKIQFQGKCSLNTIIIFQYWWDLIKTALNIESAVQGLFFRSMLFWQCELVCLTT